MGNDKGCLLPRFLQQSIGSGSYSLETNISQNKTFQNVRETKDPFRSQVIQPCKLGTNGFLSAEIIDISLANTRPVKALDSTPSVVSYPNETVLLELLAKENRKSSLIQMFAKRNSSICNKPTGQNSDNSIGKSLQTPQRNTKELFIPKNHSRKTTNTLQSFFEKVPGQNLLAQSENESEFVKNATPGPGHYSPSLKEPSKARDFSKLQGRSEPKIDSDLGPGSYMIKEDNTFSINSYFNRMSFDSRVKRFDIGKNNNINIGPGKYFVKEPTSEKKGCTISIGERFHARLLHWNHTVSKTEQENSQNSNANFGHLTEFNPKQLIKHKKQASQIYYNQKFRIGEHLDESENLRQPTASKTLLKKFTPLKSLANLPKIILPEEELESKIEKTLCLLKNFPGPLSLPPPKKRNKKLFL
mgnify:CR=1 FL=1